MKGSTVRSLSVRRVLPGALTGALGWQLLQSRGAAFVGRVVQRTSEAYGETYGVFALVLGLMGWIFVAACVVVLSVEINVVRDKGLYPRSLLAPFSKQADLTRADEETFADSATATRATESEHVDVSFEAPDDVGGDDRATR